MAVKIIVLFLSTQAVLVLGILTLNPLDLARQSSVNLDVDVGNINGKNFSNLQEAIEDAEQQFNRMFEFMSFPSMVMAMAHRGKLLYNNSWGYIDLENQVKADVHSRYRLCSISKTFTSAMINHLVDKGLIAYDTPVQDIIPDFPAKFWQDEPVNITIGQLLSHTAGTHITDLDKDFTNLTETGGEFHLVRKYQDEPLLFKPGTKFAYSNFGFDLLGAVVEILVEKLYPDAIQSFLADYGIFDTLPETQKLILPNRARYYARKNPLNATDKNLRPTYLIDDVLIHEGFFASGGLLSTVGDLLEWGQLMLDCFKGRHDQRNLPLKQETIAKMWQPHTEDLAPSINSPNPIHYGYGWFITNQTAPTNLTINIRDYIWHSGGLLGTTTILMVDPVNELVGAAMTNVGSAIGLDSCVAYLAENVFPFVKDM